MGNLRLWNMQPNNSPTLELVQGADPQGRVLQTALPLNYYAGYMQFLPGTYPVTIYRVGDRQTPVKSFNAQLRPDTYVTIIVSQGPGGTVGAELVDDTPDPVKPPSNRLTVRQFCPNVRVQVTAAGRVNTDLLEVGRAQTLEGLPDGVVQLMMHATAASGGVKTWNAEADFRPSRHASLLIFADGYGRIRPRVTVDGPSPAAEDATAKSSAPPLFRTP